MKIQLTRTRECRRLTLWGWLLVTGCIALLVYVWSVTIHGFLAQNKPVEASILIVEGYVPDSVLDSVVFLQNRQQYLLLVCAGLPLDKGALFSGFESYADYNAAVLRAKGIDSLKIVSASAQPVEKDRTYTTALAAKKKLRDLGYQSGNLNVVCSDTHGRRSLILYRKAFKPEWNVGVVSFSSNQYPKAWWLTSEGARAVVYEMFAYLYCAIFFRP